MTFRRERSPKTNRRSLVNESARQRSGPQRVSKSADFAGETKKSATDRIRSGQKKLKPQQAGTGLGQRNGIGRQSGPDAQKARLPSRRLSRPCNRARHDNGITFWDSADQYGTHPHLREALKTVPRDKVTVLSKTHASTEKEMRADLDRFRKELNTDYIDILLLHAMMDGDWDQRKAGAMSVITEAQAKGIIRTKGTSCHTLEALKTAAKSPWVEVDLARFNPAQVAMDADPATVYGVLQGMKAQGKGVIGMKILGAGKLQDRPDEALQYALAHNVIDCFTIGAESREQMQDLIRRIPAASVRG